MYFHTLFHPHAFSQMFSNNNFQFLNTYTSGPLSSASRKTSSPFKKICALKFDYLMPRVAIGWVGYDLSWVINELGI